MLERDSVSEPTKTPFSLEIPRTKLMLGSQLMVEIRNGDVNNLVMESTDSRIIDTTPTYSVIQITMLLQRMAIRMEENGRCHLSQMEELASRI